MTRKLLFATHNRGKLREMRELLTSLDRSQFEIIGADDFEFPEVEETGKTFAQNATLKALAAMKASGLPALADDSGLMVDALDGRPGVHSARYGGPASTEFTRNQLLLKELASVPTPQRTARFCCVVAYVAPEKPAQVILKEGQCEGTILKEHRGSNGFGYDPVFYVESLGQTFAECSAEDKNRISHRGRAMTLMAKHLAHRI